MFLQREQGFMSRPCLSSSGRSDFIEKSRAPCFHSENKGSCHVPVSFFIRVRLTSPRRVKPRVFTARTRPCHVPVSFFIRVRLTSSRRVKPGVFTARTRPCHIPVSFFIRVRSTSSRRVKTRAFTARTRSAVSLTSSWQASASAAPRTCTRASSSTRR